MTNKKNIINRLKQYQQNLIEELNKTIQELRQGGDLAEGEVIDPEDASFQANSIEMMHNYQSLVNSAKIDLNKLESLTEINADTPIPGALVEAGPVLFFLGISTKPISVGNGVQLIGISIDSDMAFHLRTKKPGDSISFGDTEHLITDIH